MRNARLIRLLRMRTELDALIMDEMEPWQQTALDYVARHPDATSSDLAHACKTTLPHASTVLKQLADLGLLERNEERNEDGRVYHYYRRYSNDLS